MSFTKTREELELYYNIGARKFTDSKTLGVLFETSEKVIKELLPPPLELPSNLGGLIFIAEYSKTNLGPGYLEAALFINCKYDGEEGIYCLSMPIMSEEDRLYNGRDIFGYPKKMAKISLVKDGSIVKGRIERYGVKLIEIVAEMKDSIPELPSSGPNFLFKASPRIDLKPGFDGPVLLCRQQSSIELKSLEVGQAMISFNYSEKDPWTIIDPFNVIGSFYLVSDNTMLPGRVLSEVDGEAYLPYYFKMTDFFTDKK